MPTSELPIPEWLDWTTQARPATEPGHWIALWPLYGADRWRIGTVDRWSVLDFV